MLKYKLNNCTVTTDVEGQVVSSVISVFCIVLHCNRSQFSFQKISVAKASISEGGSCEV